MQRRYCPKTCGVCDAADAEISVTNEVNGGEEPTKYNYTDPCGYISLPQKLQPVNELTNGEWAGIVLGVALVLILIAMYLKFRNRQRDEYDSLESVDG
jgi:hypothetical protein